MKAAPGSVHWVTCLFAAAAAYRDHEDMQAIATDARGHFHIAREALGLTNSSIGKAARAASAGDAGVPAQLNGSRDVLLSLRDEGRNFSLSTNPAVGKLAGMLGDNSENIERLLKGRCPAFPRDNEIYGCKLGCDCGSRLRGCHEGEGTCGVLQMAQTIAGSAIQDCLDATLGRCQVRAALVAGISLGVLVVLMIPFCLCRLLRKKSRPR